MFLRRRLAVFRKGVLRYVILQALSKRPMHGYEIMKSVGDDFGGLYRPSSGAVYPTIKALENEGYVTGEEKDGKRVYTATSQGIAYMKAGEEKVTGILEKRREFLEERKPLNRELRNLSSLILTNYRDLDKSHADAIALVLKDARRKISDIIFE
ncbi:MAG: PadR family transcriptional regulator [Candidatus Hermodarchaeia archaeon]